MGRDRGSLIDRFSWRGEYRRWVRAVGQADRTDLPELRRQRGRARSLRLILDRLIHTADNRLAPLQTPSDAIRAPQGTDWKWRPGLWRGPLERAGHVSAPSQTPLGGDVTLFHDCDRREMALRQIRNLRETDLAPYGLSLDVFGFGGSFLSLVIDLPPEAVAGLRRKHLVRVEPILELEEPLEIFARLNIRHGPNTEQLVRELPLDGDDRGVEFDLAYSNVNEKRVERMWLDLIFEGPRMNRVVLRDLTFSRRPRAEL